MLNRDMDFKIFVHTSLMEPFPLTMIYRQGHWPCDFDLTFVFLYVTLILTITFELLKIENGFIFSMHAPLIDPFL